MTDNEETKTTLILIAIMIALVSFIGVLAAFGFFQVYKQNVDRCNIPMLPNQGFIKPLQCYGYNLCSQQADLCANIYGNSTPIQNLAEVNYCEYHPEHNNYSVNFTRPDGSSVWC